MNFDIVIKRAGILFSFISGLLLVIQALAPDAIKSNNYDFIITVLKNAIPELILLFVLGLIFYKLDVLKQKLTNYKYKRILLILVLIFTLVNYNNFRNILRARYFHYTHIEDAHKKHIYSKISKDLKSAEYFSAVERIDRLIDIYPDENQFFGYLKKELTSKSKYSQKIYKVTDEKVLIKDPINNYKVSKKHLLNLFIAHSIYPHSNYLNELKKVRLVLANELEYFSKEFDEMREDRSLMINYLKEKKWFVLDEDIEINLKNKQISLEDYFAEFLSNNSKYGCVRILENKWYFFMFDNHLR